MIPGKYCNEGNYIQNCTTLNLIFITRPTSFAANEKERSYVDMFDNMTDLIKTFLNI